MPTGWRSTYRLEKKGRRQLSVHAHAVSVHPFLKATGARIAVYSRRDFEDCAKDAQLDKICHGERGRMVLRV